MKKEKCIHISACKDTSQKVLRLITVFTENTLVTLDVVTAIADTLNQKGYITIISCEPTDNELQNKISKNKLYTEVCQ